MITEWFPHTTFYSISELDRMAYMQNGFIPRRSGWDDVGFRRDLIKKSMLQLKCRKLKNIDFAKLLNADSYKRCKNQEKPTYYLVCIDFGVVIIEKELENYLIQSECPESLSRFLRKCGYNNKIIGDNRFIYVKRF